ncbi:MAG: hypothetical protein JNN12_12120 [Bacteroidetes Order II. Incertae sedis bacterium]|nr:hypothetical protein [Bacteroidetes Order II. bacterium]
MKNKTNWPHILFIIGVVATLLGAIDPLEGSIVIFIGSVLLAFSTRLSHDPDHKTFLMAFVLMAIGVTAMWIFTALGGIGGTSPYPLWWGILILPYPIGWFLALYALIRRWLNRKHINKPSESNAL